MNSLFQLKQKTCGVLYRYGLKQIFFRFDPETVHDRMLKFGKNLGRHELTRRAIRGLFAYRNTALEQDIAGIHFINPIGLAAGFDKNAELLNIIPDVGFGFEEVGSITGEPCEGNPKPRLWRLKKSKSLLVYYGLKNKGCEILAQEMRGKKFNVPVGISVAKTNSPATTDMQAGVADYAKAYQSFAEIGDYITINISCPNAFGGQPFTDPTQLAQLLATLSSIPLKPSDKPIFLKLSPDLSFAQIDQILEIVMPYRITGFICSNLTKNRDNKKIVDTDVPEIGGMSGKVVEELSNEFISYLYKKTRGKYIVIGCGGVFTAEDAYKKIKLGASLIQLITGMIFEGPQVIGAINYGLVELLKRDGYKNISEAVGALHR